jgi:hypothetical protein
MPELSTSGERPLLSRLNSHEPKLIPLGKYQILFNELKKNEVLEQSGILF